MKVIDLLNKLANNEEVPKTIELCGYKYQYNAYFNDYKAEDMESSYWLITDFVEFDTDLREEVEIIEDTPKEDKKIEKLDLKELNDLLRADLSYDNLFHKTHKMLVETKSKINEIINKINRGEE